MQFPNTDADALDRLYTRYKAAPSESHRDRIFDDIARLLRPVLSVYEARHIRRQGQDACRAVTLTALFRALETYDATRGNSLLSHITFRLYASLLDEFSPRIAREADPHRRGLCVPLESEIMEDGGDPLILAGALIDPAAEEAFRDIEDAAETTDILDRAWAALPHPNARQAAVWQTRRQGLTYREIAEACGLSEKQVDNCCNNLRLSLRAAWRGRESDLGV